MAMKLTPQETFDLGQAYASFGCGDIDQGISIILPTTDGTNAVFKSLFDNYFVHLTVPRHPRDAIPDVCYMWAIDCWLFKIGGTVWAKVTEVQP